MIEIKVLQPDDWPLWRELRLQALAEAPHAFGSTLAQWQGDRDREQRWRARLAIPGSQNLIAYLGGRPVGMASGVPAAGDDDPDAVELISLWVSPEARGRGVAGRLLGEIEQWAAGAGLFRTMRLSVVPSNEAALALYRRNGLRETGDAGDPTPDGTGRELVMAKPIVAQEKAFGQSHSDFADKWPQCEVIGTDISPIQPTWVPPNVKFEIEDCTQEWTFAPDNFDFVHIRYLQGCIPDWFAFVGQAFRVLKPGGYLEGYEASTNVFSEDGTLPSKSAIAQWGPMFVNGGKMIGRSFTIVDDDMQRKAMQAAGFVDIQEKWIKVPGGGWPADPKMREIGVYAAHAIESDVEGFILFITNVLGWSREEVTVYIAHLRRELRSLRHHVCYWQKVVWGRKPEGA